MDVDSPRVWPSSIIQEPSQPPLDHAFQAYNYQLSDPSFSSASMSTANALRAQFGEGPNRSLYSENNLVIRQAYHTQPSSSGPTNFLHPNSTPYSDSLPTSDSSGSSPHSRPNPKIDTLAELLRTQVPPESASPGSDTASTSGGAGANHYPSSSGVPRLPPILQVEKRQVTTSATQLASASRRRNEAHFVCPVPDCGSTFTRRFNLRGHLRSHTEERPYICDWAGCKKGFARQHDCKRHQALHTTAKSQSNVCQGCKKTFSRMDALNRHLRSEGGADCRASGQKENAENDSREGGSSHRGTD